MYPLIEDFNLSTVYLLSWAWRKPGFLAGVCYWMINSSVQTIQQLNHELQQIPSVLIQILFYRGQNMLITSYLYVYKKLCSHKLILSSQKSSSWSEMNSSSIGHPWTADLMFSFTKRFLISNISTKGTQMPFFVIKSYKIWISIYYLFFCSLL